MLINIRSLAHAFLFLFVFIIPIWPEYAAIKFGSLPGLNPQRIIFIPMLSLWLLFIKYNNQSFKNIIKELLNEKWLLILSFSYLIVRFVSIIYSPDPLASTYVVINDVLYFFFLIPISSSLLDNQDRISNATILLVIAGIIVLIIGVTESILGKNVISTILEPTNKDMVLALASKARGSYRVQSTFSNPLALAQYILLIFPLSVYQFRYGKYPIFKFMGFIFIILGIINIFLTGSRTPIVIAILLFLWYAISGMIHIIRHTSGYLKLKFLILIVPIISGILIFSTVEMTQLIKGRTNLEQGSGMVRILQLANGIPLIKAKPIVGYGPGKAAEEIGVGRVGTNHYTVDNYYLTLAVESGLPAMLLFTLIFFNVIKNYYKRSKTPDTNRISIFLNWSLLAFILSLGVLSLKEIFPIAFFILAMSDKSYKIQNI